MDGGRQLPADDDNRCYVSVCAFPCCRLLFAGLHERWQPMIWQSNRTGGQHKKKRSKRESCSTEQIAIADRPAPEEPDGEGCKRVDHTIQIDTRCLNDSFEAPFFSSIETSADAGAHYMIVGLLFFLFFFFFFIITQLLRGEL